MKSQLRPLQVEAITRLRASLASGKRRPILSCPTGFGKTVIAAALVEMALAKGKRVCFVAPAISLIDQTVTMFGREGINDIGVIQADHPMTDYARMVQVASVQTLERRGWPDVDLVVTDECHRVFKNTLRWMADPAWAHVPFIGLSATPWTRGLGKHYDDLINVADTERLINDGWLAPFRVFAPAHPDLSKVRTVAGDYHEGDLSDVMGDAQLVADVVSTWLAHGENRPTISFGVDCAHAQKIQADFLGAGVACEYVDAFTTRLEREAIRKRFHSGETRVVSSVGTLTTGIDWDVRCIILARPTKSEMLFVQIIGRGLRTAPGKTDLRILDHADNHSRLGFVTDIKHATLDDGKKREANKPDEKKPALPKECGACTFLMPPKTRICPNCGQERIAQSEIETKEGELAEMERGGKRAKAANREFTHEQKQAWYSSLLSISQDRSYSIGWAAHKFKTKFGVWPNNYSKSPCEPLPEVRSWVRSQQIAWAHSKKRQEANNATAS